MNQIEVKCNELPVYLVSKLHSVQQNCILVEFFHSVHSLDATKLNCYFSSVQFIFVTLSTLEGAFSLRTSTRVAYA